MKKLFLLAPVLIICLAGCGAEKSPLAPIQGVVTLDGEPLEGAVVRFFPIATGDSIVAGPSTIGKTDSQGVFGLETVDGRRGASVGSNVVRISKFPLEEGQGGTARDLLPKRYNAKSELTFQVEPGVTNSANFDLESR